jgi:DNA-binding response OmpR family regulator
MRVLFVENHHVFAETVIDQFLQDYEVVLAPTVAEAKAVLTQSFDVVLVDYDLPDGKGTEVVRALRAMHFRGNVVAVSSREEGNAELRAAGAKVTCAKRDFRAIAAAIARTVASPPTGELQNG